MLTIYYMIQEGFKRHQNINHQWIHQHCFSLKIPSLVFLRASIAHMHSPTLFHFVVVSFCCLVLAMIRKLVFKLKLLEINSLQNACSLF